MGNREQYERNRNGDSSQHPHNGSSSKSGKPLSKKQVPEKPQPKSVKQDSGKKYHDTMATVEKTIHRLKKSKRKIPFAVAAIACVFLIVGVVMGVMSLGDKSKATAMMMPPQNILESTTDAYHSGLVAIGKIDESIANGAPMIPLAPREYDPIIYSYPPAGKRVCLTFDDGPSQKMVDDYLKVLGDNGVKGTFFMLANSVRAFPEESNRIKDAGHDVASHSKNHSVLPKLSQEELNADFEDVNRTFKEVLGAAPKYMRPPYGEYNDNVLETAKKYGQLPIYWSIDTNDWRKYSTETMINTILANLSDGAVILMHEGKENTLEALPAMIKAIREAGYEIVSLSEMLQY